MADYQHLVKIYKSVNFSCSSVNNQTNCQIGNNSWVSFVELYVTKTWKLWLSDLRPRRSRYFWTTRYAPLDTPTAPVSPSPTGSSMISFPVCALFQCVWISLRHLVYCCRLFSPLHLFSHLLASSQLLETGFSSCSSSMLVQPCTQTRSHGWWLCLKSRSLFKLNTPHNFTIWK